LAWRKERRSSKSPSAKHVFERTAERRIQVPVIGIAFARRLLKVTLDPFDRQSHYRPSHRKEKSATQPTHFASGWVDKCSSGGRQKLIDERHATARKLETEVSRNSHTYGLLKSRYAKLD
jgi:hypothetical protein